MKPGYQTTEFWTALIAQALALLTVLGLVTPADGQTLDAALGKCIAAVFALLANGAIVVQYIKSRLTLKTLAGAGQPKDASAGQGGGSFLWLGFALWLVGSPVQAQSILPWRNQMEQRLRDQNQLITQLLGKQQQAPIIIQQLPIGGELKQQLPIAGEPKQALPVPGEPKQQLPPGGAPKQDLPIGGPPLQSLPYMPPAGVIQPYSRLRALTFPIQ